MSQPALSRRIALLEASLGCQLFDRTTRQVRLTAAGQAFLVGTEQALATLRGAIDDAKEIARGAGGVLRIGSFGSSTVRLLPLVISAHRRKYPDLSMTVAELGGKDQVQALINSEIDLGLLRFPASHHSIVCEHLTDEPLAVVVPDDHPLAAMERVTLSAVGEHEIMLFARDDNPYQYDRIVELCESAGFSPSVWHQAHHPQFSFSLVSARLGITIVGGDYADMHFPGLVVRLIEDATVGMYVAFRSDRSVVVDRFLDTLRETLPEYQERDVGADQPASPDSKSAPQPRCGPPACTSAPLPSPT